jgi:hypothetical protein
MAAALTTTRQAIATALAGKLSLPADWRDGRLEPPVERGDVACTWVAGTREIQGRVDIEEVTIAIRVLSAVQRGRGAKNSLDPAKLEQWRDDILVTLSPVQTTLGGWYLRPTASSIDPRLGVVDVSIAVWQDNVFKTV